MEIHFQVEFVLRINAPLFILALMAKFVLAEDVNIDAKESFVASELIANQQLENVSVNQTLLEAQITFACHVNLKIKIFTIPILTNLNN